MKTATPILLGLCFAAPAMADYDGHTHDVVALKTYLQEALAKSVGVADNAVHEEDGVMTVAKDAGQAGGFSSFYAQFEERNGNPSLIEITRLFHTHQQPNALSSSVGKIEYKPAASALLTGDEAAIEALLKLQANILSCEYTS